MPDNAKTTCALIGGSPSTGSSLLVNILHRHPAICAGPETYLFTHPALYMNWTKYRKHLLNPGKFGGLKSIGWFRKNGVDLLQEEYGWNRFTLESLIRESNSFPAFARAFFEPFRELNRAEMWVEKSPSNALVFDLFLVYFEHAKVIHTCRDPYDTVASLVARGMNPFQACSAYLVNTAFALKQASGARYFLLKYEDWVSRPGEELPRLLSFLEKPWEPAILEPGQSDKAVTVKMAGWQQNEKGSIQASSIGRFERLEETTKRLIRETFSMVHINEAFAQQHDLPVLTLREICRALEYPSQEVTVSKSTRAAVNRWSWQDWQYRLLRFYPTAWGHYPVSVSE